MSSTNILNRAANKLGNGVIFEGLLKKVGRLEKTFAAKADEILGFDYLAKRDEICYEFYCANSPVERCTVPCPVPGPLGITHFYNYKIDYKRAIEIFHSGNWGEKFASIVLYKPIHSITGEPYWYFISNIGKQVIIGADSGKIIV